MKAYKRQLISACIVVLAAANLYFLYSEYHDQKIRAVGVAFVALIVLSCFFYVKSSVIWEQDAPPISSVKRFVLVNQEGENEKQWGAEGAKSFLIGKSPQADMNLGDNHYADYVANEHAVLNYAGGYWYVEDLNSQNGVGIRKQDEEFTFRIKPMTSYKIDPGDVIFVARVKILVE